MKLDQTYILLSLDRTCRCQRCFLHEVPGLRDSYKVCKFEMFSSCFPLQTGAWQTVHCKEEFHPPDVADHAGVAWNRGAAPRSLLLHLAGIRSFSLIRAAKQRGEQTFRIDLG